jgi:hypothetical protein
MADEKPAKKAPAAEAAADPVVELDSAHEWVMMKHPDVENEAGPVTRQALDEVWDDLGWKFSREVPTSDDGRPMGVPEEG